MLVTRYIRRFFHSTIRRNSSYNFITIPIFYANADPHIGHLYTAVLGDVIRRWDDLKIRSNDSNGNATTSSGRRIFVTGTDEHGIKMENAAKRLNCDVKTLCDANSKKFLQLYELLNIPTDDFLRTSEQKHRHAVEHFWRKLMDSGNIYKDTYEGWYSAMDEYFYGKGDVVTITDEKSGEKKHVSKETGSVVEYTKETNYMFDVKKFSDRIRNWLTHEDVIYPAHFLPFALQYLRHDSSLSVSRDSNRLKWGIPVPDDPSQTIYVWLDALVSYLTAAGYPDNNFQWPPHIQILGKDILKFHAMYWPAFLMAADLPLPKKLYVHGHWLVNKVKMSKSIGNVVDPFEAAKILTVDGLRYFFVRYGAIPNDENFNYSKVAHLVNGELVNDLGNLLHRSVQANMNPTQEYPGFDLNVVNNDVKSIGDKLVMELKTLHERVGIHFDNLAFQKGIDAIEETVRHANTFFHAQAPWKMSQGEELSTILFLTYEACRISSVLLQPIVPDLANRILSRLGMKPNERHLKTAQLGGGPMMEMYGRPLGKDNGVPLQRIAIKNLDTT